MVKDYYKVKDLNKDQFAGDIMNYPVCRRRFIATVHSQRMLISDKALALSTALDKKVDLLGNMIRGLHYDPTTSAILIAELERLYGGRPGDSNYSIIFVQKSQSTPLVYRLG
jgi:hypothetical protein